jgi:D-glycero-alpha-D-manno-heptose-7-phosphate kinase
MIDERPKARRTFRVREQQHLVRSRAPLRISFAGGGTDVAPYPERFGGCVLSCTINKYAYVTIRARSDKNVAIRSLDYGLEFTYDPNALGGETGKLRLVESILRRFHASGIDIFMHSDAPPGSGLGSSSAMIVALCAALARFGAHELSRYELAELAYEIERDDLGISGGMQDQYAASFGGFNFIEFDANRVVVNPLRMGEDTLDELHYNLMLCFTGGTRISSNILAEQTQRVSDSNEDALTALHRMKALTLEIKSLLLRDNLAQFGEALHESWMCKRGLASSISNEHIDALYTAAKEAGAWGGKILGAGGGGYLLLAVPFWRRSDVAHALELLGGKMTDFQFDTNGVRTWTADEGTWDTDARHAEA